MAKKLEIDRLSALPDTILSCNIFSHLSLRDIVRTSVLSTRWRFLWKQIPNLDFSEECFESLMCSFENNAIDEYTLVDCMNNIVGKTLLLHSGHIERCCIHVAFSRNIMNIFMKLWLERWIHYAAKKEVKHLALKISSEELDIPQSLFNPNLLRHLELESVRFTGIPTEFDGFRFLQSCTLSCLHDLMDDGLEQLIGLCPLLENLVLLNCCQLVNLRIGAPNLHFLSIEDCWSMKSLTADCPQLVELEIKNCEELNEFKELIKFSFRGRGIPIGFGGFRSLKSCFLSELCNLTDDGLEQLIRLCPLLHKLVLVSCPELINLKIQAPNLNSLILVNLDQMESLTADCPQLVELEIENCFDQLEFKMNSRVLFHDLHTSDVQIPKEHPMLNSLRKLSLKACPIVLDLSLLTTLGCFRNLEEVNIQICEEDHREERAKGEVVADSTFPSLKKVHVDISKAMTKQEAIMLAFLLKNAPSLNTITVALPCCLANIHDKEFINKVLDLQHIYEKVDIRMKMHGWRYDAICMETSKNDFINIKDLLGWWLSERQIKSGDLWMYRETCRYKF